MLVQITNLSPGINVGSVSVDFELAIHNAFRNEFSDLEIRGCFFHLLQNLKKQIGTAGLMASYRNNADFNLYARMITALAFVPPEYVVNSFETLSEELEQVEPTLQPILDWLEMYYIGILRREGVRRVPAFPIETWNFLIELKKVQAERDIYYEFLVCGHEPPPTKKKYVEASNRILNLVQNFGNRNIIEYLRGLAHNFKTNNIAEASHWRLQAQLCMNHPTIWQFIIELKKVKAKRDIYYEFLVSGHEPPPTKKKYVEASNRILNLVQNFGNRNIIEYLRGLVHNFVMEH
ncbi:THAP-type domain-containing protein, partial [Aphis craccivora]